MRAPGLLLLLAVVTACSKPATPSVGPLPAGAGATAPAAPAETPDPAAISAPAESPDPAEASAFERLGPPQMGDWRERFPGDVPMDFDDYVDSDPVRADDGRRAIAFQPVGDFSPDQRAVLDAAAEFTGIWFDLPVAALDPVPLTDESEQFRDRGERGESRQYHTRWFLYSLLPDRVPDDAVVLLGVTMADLWPGAGWNYVFGQADLRRRVGVYSLARYFPEFWGDDATPDAARLALERTLKVVVHEAGHTFGLEHCVTWACAMNGSNSLGETDWSPLYLCPDCVEKLAWNRGFDVQRRHERLADALAEHGLDDTARWHRARAASMR